MFVENSLLSLEQVARLPTVDDFIHNLLTCRRTKDSKRARRLCVYYLFNDELQKSEGLGNYVVPTLVDCGNFDLARLVFRGLHHPTASSWTALVHGFNDCGEHQQAHDVFQKMQIARVQLSSYSYQAFVKTAVSLKNIMFGRDLHVEIVKLGHDNNQIIAVTLIEMYVKCGFHAEAWFVLEKLSVQDVVSWNILITDYADNGLAKEVLDCLKLMEDIHLSPDVITLIGCLKACSCVEDLNTGRELHTSVQKFGYDENTIASNTLVAMYMNCGSVSDAEKVFHAIPAQTVVSWNILLAGYLENGFEEDMLSCLDKMQLQGLSYTHVTAACSLCCCSRLENINSGRTVHAAIITLGLESHPSVGSSLVEMYMSTGMFDEGQKIFDALPVKNVVCWTALISGFAEHGHVEIALDGYALLCSAGASPDASLYICLLECSCTARRPHTIFQIHSDIVKRGLETDACVTSALIDAYSTTDLLLEAQNVLGELPVSQVLSCMSRSWCNESKFDSPALLMQAEDLLAIGTTFSTPMFVGGLKVCSNVAAPDLGCKIHTKILSLGLERDLSLAGALLSMYSKCRWFAEAYYIHHNGPSIVSVTWWNSLMLGFTDSSTVDQVLVCLNKMQVQGVDPNEVTFMCCLKACGKLQDARKGFEVHSTIAREGIESDALVGNSLVAMYAKLGLLLEALDAFSELPMKDAVSWNSIMAGHADRGMDEAVLNCLKEMQSEYIAPNRISFVLSLKACSNLCAVERGLPLHEETVLKGLEDNVFIENALLDLYAKSGMLAEAMQVFNMVSAHNQVLWNTLVGAFAYSGETHLLQYVVLRMQEDGIKPDGLTYAIVLAASSHAGLLEEGKACFYVLHTAFNVLPFHELYNCTIDLFGRAGQLTTAVSLLEVLPFQPDLVSWRVMLGACRKWRNIELGRHAFKSVIGLSNTEAASYMLMLNMYADHEDDSYVINHATRCSPDLPQVIGLEWATKSECHAEIEGF